MAEFKRQARIAKAFSYVLAVLAVIHLGYVGYNAVANGTSAIGFRSGVVRFMFRDDPLPSMLVLLVNTALALLLLGAARACYREHEIWIK